VLLARTHKTVKACVIAVLALLASAPVTHADDPPAQGQPEQGVYSSTWGVNPYTVYLPVRYGEDPGRLPLVVMVHGCNTTAAQQEAANLFDQLADRERFVVLYPDHDTATATSVGTHPLQCWRWYDPASNLRDSGDPNQIAGMTRQVMADHRIDPQRVYVIGMSSGAMLTSILGATYPDLYAAIGNVAGCPYGGTACLGNDRWHAVENTDAEARLAHRAQGEHARVVPFLSIHGDADTTVDPGESANVTQQWLKTNNLALGDALDAPLPLAPAEERTTAPAGGHPYLTQDFRDPQGCLIGRRIFVHGMGHFWPGGSSDPRWFEYEDPKGPSGAEAAWAFFAPIRLATSHGACR
jgi:poly(hydroxyalkanoate) depolymerase family esterase